MNEKIERSACWMLVPRTEGRQVPTIEARTMQELAVAAEGEMRRTNASRPTRNGTAQCGE